MKFTRVNLGYNLASLEPYIDKETMNLHYNMHYKGYTDKLNSVLEKYPRFRYKKVEDMMRNYKKLKMTKEDLLFLKNNGGGYLNHSLYFSTMAPKKNINSTLLQRIQKSFPSLKNFKEKFNSAAMSVFGSGWTWLVEDARKKLIIYQTANQDSPYMKGLTPLIGVDVWEHAYYLKYQNRRAEYIHNWWKVLKLI
jgi:Fe-Mn family superoxide dismutase